MILYRPVGLKELELIYDNNFKGFPPRLEGQPIFYPVTNVEYAKQIARDWNTNDNNSGFVGFVTEFQIDDVFLNNYEKHIVGSKMHEEYWIPASDLQRFNDKIQNRISVIVAFFGKDYVGYDPKKLMLGNKSAKQQFLHLCKIKDYSGFDFILELKANKKAVFLNYPFWNVYDFSEEGVDKSQKQKIIDSINTIWNAEIADFPLITNSYFVK